MQPFHNGFESIPLIIRPDKIKSIRPKCAKSGADDHRKSSYKIIIEMIQILINHAVMISLVLIIPIGRIRFQCKLHGADRSCRDTRRNLFVQICKIKFAVFFVRNFFHMIVTVFLYTCTVWTGFKERSRLIIALCRTAWNLDKNLNQIPFSVPIHIII